MSENLKSYILYEVARWLAAKRETRSFKLEDVVRQLPQLNIEILDHYEKGLAPVPGFLFFKLARLYEVDEFEIWHFMNTLRKSPEA